MATDDPFGFTGLTYDDVMLLPAHTDVIPSEADTTSRLTRNISVWAPIVSSAMDTALASLRRLATTLCFRGSWDSN